MTDLRYAFRQLWKEPRFTIAAVLALALGIGANTAIFSVVNAILLKPLPFPHAEQLVAIGAQDTREHTSDLYSLSFPDFRDFRDQAQTFQNMAVYKGIPVALTGFGAAQSLAAQEVSGEFFEILGVKPALGRGFTRAEEVAAGGPNGFTVVISHELWARVFKSDPAILGQTIRLDGQPHTVVGIMPPGFRFPIGSETDAYVTVARDSSTNDGGKPQNEQRGNHSYRAIGRLKPGVPVVQGSAELRTIAAALEKQYPDSNTHFTAEARPLRTDLVGDVASALYVLFAAVACVLLIACANVANLLLARATVRTKEIAVRSALGASRGQIIRQLLIESVLLSAIGGALGLVLAAWGTDVLVKLVPQNIPRISAIKLDGLVLTFTVAVSLATGILFGLAPALHATRQDLRGALNETGRSTIGSARHRLRSALVVGEVAIALLLLTGAGLLLQTFQRLSRVDPGMRTDRLLSAMIALPDAAYPKPENIRLFYEQLLPRLRALPGVRSAATIVPLPLSGSDMETTFDLEEHPKPEGQQDAAAIAAVSTRYFETQRVPLIRGRVFNDSDGADSKQVVMINQKFADKYFAREDPIGKRMRPGMSSGPEEKGPMREVIGVVGNTKFLSLRQEPAPQMYIPVLQMPMPFGSILVRTETSSPAALTSAVQSELAKVDANVPLLRVRVYDEYMDRALARPRFNALLLSIFAGVALLLTTIGIYGVMAYSVAQRRQEIGVRMALGAQRSDVLRLIVGSGMRLTALGLLCGVAAALVLTRLLSALLFGVQPFDVPTFAIVAAALAFVALLACWLPAHRAARSNPIAALRES
jgi:putative ABC transport system permease protein